VAYVGPEPITVLPQTREQPSYFRRIPSRRGVGLPTVGTQRGYYNPQTGETMTEHQYLRRYRRGLSYQVRTPTGERRNVTPPTEGERENQQYYQREYQQGVRQRYRVGAEATGMTYQEYQRLERDREYYGFLDKQLRREGRLEESLQVRAPGSPWATTLEDMGLRPPGATWDVGTSDQVPAFLLWRAGGRVA
jgi:hypothetical protein